MTMISPYMQMIALAMCSGVPVPKNIIPQGHNTKSRYQLWREKEQARITEYNREHFGESNHG